MMDWLGPLGRTDVVDWRSAALSLLLAFALTQAMAAVYLWTFRGLSYSRSFVHTLATVSIVACTLMLAIGNSVAAGIGVAAGLSLVRFRTSLRDPRDILFVFASLAAGVASGLQAYGAALLGTGIFLGAATLLHTISFGARFQSDGLVRFFAPKSPEAEQAVSEILRTHTRSFVLVTLRAAAQDQQMEHAYQISIPDPRRRGELVAALQSIEGVRDVSLLMQEPTLEL
ncbi:MAG: DUF4956 domain-containing protein [Myxococcota bacterium]